MPCFVIELPEGDDPDSYLVKHSVEEFNDLLKRARPVLDYYLRELVSQEDTGTVAGKKAVIDKFRPYLQKSSDSVERGLYLRELSRLLSVDIRTIGMENNNSEPKLQKASAPRVVVGAAESLVALLFRYPSITDEFRSSGTEDLLPSGLRAAAAKIIEAVVTGASIEPTDIIASAGDDLNALASLLIDDTHLADIDPFKALQDFRRALERETLKLADAKSLQRELLHLDYESPRYREILETLNDLRNRKSQLS
jgi:DNA primase